MLATSQQVILALKWNALGRLSAQLVTWVITLFVMRLLTPADYGLMSLAVMMTGFFALFNDIGATPALIQKQEIDTALIRNVYGLLLVSNCILYMLIFAGAPCFAAFFNQPQLVEIVRVFGITLLLGALAAIPGALLQRELRFKSISLIDLTSTIAGSVITLLLAYFSFGVWSLVAGILIKRTVEMIMLLRVASFRLMPQFNFTELEPIFSFASKIGATQIVWYLNSNIDGLLIGRVLGKEALGLYSVTFNLAMLPANKIMSMTSQIAFATYSRMQDERARATKYFQESVVLTSLVFFPTCWGMSAVSHDLVAVVLGPKWQPASVVLQIVALGIPYRVFGPLIHPVITGIGAPGVGLRNTLTIFVFVVSGMIIGIYWGLTGLCVGGLIGTLVSVTVNLRRSLSLLNMRYTQLLELSFPSMFAAAVMYAVILITQSEVLGGFLPVTRLLFEVGLGIMVYGALTLMLNCSAAIRSLQLIRGRY